MSKHRPEEQMYVAFYRWFSYEYPKLLKFLVRHENGGYKIGVAERNIRSITGLKGGDPDYELRVARNGYHCLYIEFKYGKNKLSLKQEYAQGILREWGAKVVTVWSVEDAMAEIASYLEENNENNT
jgi:hypothetical protein